MAQDNAEAKMECIIVDDCGTDHSMDIVNETITPYQGSIQFRIVHHDKNRGLSAARNTGVNKAQGDYVLFIDSDDYLMPDAIQYMLENLSQHPKADLVMGNVKNCKGGELLIHHLQKPWHIHTPRIFFNRMLHHQIYLYAWNKLIRRSVLVDNNIQFIEGILYEDFSWTYQLFSHLSTILLLPQVTYVYENNPSSIVNTTFSSEKASKVVWSYAVSTLYLLSIPPDSTHFKYNFCPDYLFFTGRFLMNGADVFFRYKVTDESAQSFYQARRQLVRQSIRYGRLLPTLIFSLLFLPFYYIQRLALFRHNYYKIESVLCHFSHLTDFLHNKNRV
jgi:glycosyltransferase involved in cell wall biosynthesis